MKDKERRVLEYIISYFNAHGGISPLPVQIEMALNLPKYSAYNIVRSLVIAGELYFRVANQYWSLAPTTKGIPDETTNPPL